MTEPEHEDKVRFYRGADGDFRWQLCAAGNHEVIAASTEGYTSKQHARENYERVTGRKVPDLWEEPGVTDAEREQMIRTSEPSENERFLLALLDDERGKVAWVRDIGRRAYGDGGFVHAYEIMRATLSNEEVAALTRNPNANLSSLRES